MRRASRGYFHRQPRFQVARPRRLSVVWRDIVAQISWFVVEYRLHQSLQFPDPGLQKIDLLLLAKNSVVELFQMIFDEAELDFKFVDSGLHSYTLRRS